jgi:hypothetical protein
MSATSNPIFQQLQLLMTGYAYNFYGKREIARADDLLIREKASETLGQAVNALGQLEAEFGRLYIPPMTRENPVPPVQAMAQLKELTRHKDKVKDLAVRIRGLSVPSQDKTWLRFRDEVPFLQALVQFDYNLIYGTNQLRDMVLTMSAANWTDASAGAAIDQIISQLDQTLRQRTELLQVPG